MASRLELLMRRAGLMVSILLLAACGPPGNAAIPPAATHTPPAVPTLLATGAATPAEVAAITPTAFVPTLTRLTQPGCCIQPYWSPDGKIVLFIDKPLTAEKSAIYGISVEGGDAQLISERIALPSPDGRYRAYLSEEGEMQGETIVEPVGGDQQWVIPNGGLRVFFSPNSSRLAWAETARTGGDFDRQPSVIMISDIDGSEPVELTTVIGGGIAGWLDDNHLLLVGRDRQGEQEVTLFSYSIENGTRTDVTRNKRIRTVQIAPGGEWIAYSITLHPEDSSNDGLWVVKADGSQHYKLEVFGASAWRDRSHLLVIPFEPGAPSNRLWQFNAVTGQVVPLTDPAVTPFLVAQGDWSVSPTGEYVVFVNAEDQALWMITLPPIED